MSTVNKVRHSAFLEKRTQRWQCLAEFDHQLKDQFNTQWLVGTDEVGRGSLMGPVVAAAFCFLDDSPSPEALPWLIEIDDSKAAHLNHTKRTQLAGQLKTIGSWGVAEASIEEISEFNILQASLLASKRAIARCLSQLETIHAQSSPLIVLDGRHSIKDLAWNQTTVIKGDSLSASIAAASIIAKAYRDELIIHLAKEYPGYGWDKNAGYPTQAHQAAIRALGITPYHRPTYKLG